MVSNPVMSQRSELENYLHSTFAKFEDQYGQKLDILVALPTLIQILENADESVIPFADKRYEFIGYAACQFALRCILARQYPSYDDRILDALAKKFRAFNQLNKIVMREIALKQHIRHKLPLGIIQTISGVLYSYFGTPAVEKFIESAVVQISDQELGEATAFRTKLSPVENCVAHLNLEVAQNGGSVEATSNPNGKQWQVEVQVRIKPTSILFSHTRVAPSKQKAKTAAYEDIVNYIKTPEHYVQLTEENVTSNDVHPLPIPESDYCKIEVPPINTNSIRKTATPNEDHIHLTFRDDEDAILQLSRLLLGNNQSESSESGSGSDYSSAGSPTKKRMRDRDYEPMEPISKTEALVKSESMETTLTMGRKVASDYFNSDNCVTPVITPAMTSTAPFTPLASNPSATPMVPLVTSFTPMMNAAGSISTGSFSSFGSHSSMTSSLPCPAQPMDTGNSFVSQSVPATSPFISPTPPASTSNYFATQQPVVDTSLYVGGVAKPDVHPKIMAYFKKVFAPNRSTLQHALTLPSQSKSIFLSLVEQHKDTVFVEAEINSVGTPHEPIFSSHVELKSREYGNVVIKVDGISRRKKEADMHAYFKLIEYFTK